MSKATQQIAKIIRQQIFSGNKLVPMSWGMRKLYALPSEKTEHGFQRGGLQFDVNGRKLRGRVVVRYMANDLYTIEFLKRSRKRIQIPGMKKYFYQTEWKTVKVSADVYADMMKRMIDKTVESN